APGYLPRWQPRRPRVAVPARRPVRVRLFPATPSDVEYGSYPPPPAPRVPPAPALHGSLPIVPSARKSAPPGPRPGRVPTPRGGGRMVTETPRTDPGTRP